jgi:hypothetical protein
MRPIIPMLLRPRALNSEKHVCVCVLILWKSHQCEPQTCSELYSKPRKLFPGSSGEHRNCIRLPKPGFRDTSFPNPNFGMASRIPGFGRRMQFRCSPDDPGNNFLGLLYNSEQVCGSHWWLFHRMSTHTHTCFSEFSALGLSSIGMMGRIYADTFPDEIIYK